MRALLSLPAVVFLVGCVPGAGGYFEPSSASKDVIPALYGRGDGPRNGIRFERGASSVQVSLADSDRDELCLIFQFHIGGTEILHVNWNEVRFRSLNGADIELPFQPIRAFSNSLGEWSKATDIDEARFDGSAYDIYIRRACFPAKHDSKVYELFLPNMDNNGTAFPGAWITFTRRTGVWLQGLD